jgi:CPA1 family monovalent cation:H+ antiporter
VRSNRPTTPGLCDHLQQAPADAAAKTPDGCGACLAQGTSWVDLRLCLTCGEVACCDSSPWKHASAHFHETQHPVVRSFERGENWRWCYEDEMLG